MSRRSKPRREDGGKRVWEKVEWLRHRDPAGEPEARRPPAAEEDPSPAAELLERKETPRKTAASSTYGIKVEGVDDVMLPRSRPTGTRMTDAPLDALVESRMLGNGHVRFGGRRRGNHQPKR